MKGRKLIFLCLVLSAALTLPAFAEEKVTNVKISRVEATETENGYMEVELGAAPASEFFVYPHNTFIPGDTASGNFCFTLKAGVRPVALKLSAVNAGDQTLFNALNLKVTDPSDSNRTVYNGKLSDVGNAELIILQNDSKADIQRTLKLEMTFPSGKDINVYQNKKLEFSFELTAEMTDYIVYSNRQQAAAGGDVEVYQSLHNNNYYYTKSGKPVLEDMQVSQGEGGSIDYKPDYFVELGDRSLAGDDHYLDYAENDRKVYIGKNLHFGDEDDAKPIFIYSGGTEEADGSNVRRGTETDEASQFGGPGHTGGDHYYNGADKIPGTDDDCKIYAGADGKYGTRDDYYITSARNSTRPGADLIWGTKDDELWDAGEDLIYGNWDDILVGYPNDTEKKPDGSYSGGGSAGFAITGGFDSSVSPVGFAKSVEGLWEKDALGRWTFTTGGQKAKSKWVNVYSKTLDQSDWYYFDANGIMQTGWQKTGNGKWYYLRTVEDGRFGAMEKGLIYDSTDGNYYYLDKVNGVMQTGWIKINDKYYYFNESASTANWFWDTRIGRWAYNKLGGRSYGAMYRNEITPDGKHVDKNGARID